MMRNASCRFAYLLLSVLVPAAVARKVVGVDLAYLAIAIEIAGPDLVLRAVVLIVDHRRCTKVHHHWGGELALGQEIYLEPIVPLHRVNDNWAALGQCTSRNRYAKLPNLQPIGYGGPGRNEHYAVPHNSFAG